MARTVPGMRTAQLNQTSFGPFGKGAIDTANALLNLQGALKDAKNLYVVGLNQVLLRNGTTPVMTFQDDQGTPANVTSIRAIAPFKDRALVVAHSTVTSKAYAYIVASDFSGYYDPGDTLHTTTTAKPTVVLWTSITTPPDVFVAEGLGIAFIAHATAADATALNWATYRLAFNLDGGAPNTWTAATLQSNLDGAGSATIYFSGVITFEQHLWGWGFGSGTSAGGNPNATPPVAAAYNPSRIRFSNPIFGSNDGPSATVDGYRDFFDSTDDIDLGNRTDSAREKILTAAVAGNTLFLFGYETVSRIQGYGRDSWQKTIADTTYGISGPKAAVSTGDVVYYWTARGPARLKGYVWYGQEGRPEPLWDAVAAAAALAAVGGDPTGVVAGFARDLDQVQWYYQANATAGLVQFAAYDIRRDIWLGPDSTIGAAIACAGLIEPVYTATSEPGPPAGAPTLTAATGVGTTQATANWTAGDSAAQTEVSIELHTGGSWSVIVTLGAGQETYTFTGLVSNTAYDVRVRHLKNGQYSSYSTNTTPYFTTTTPTALAPSNLAITSFGPPGTASDATGQLTWTVNEADSQTEIYEEVVGGSSYNYVATTGAGASSYTIGPVDTTGTYGFEVRAVKSGYTASALVGPVSAELFTYTGAV